MPTPTIGLMTTDVPQTARHAVFDHTWLLLAEAGVTQDVRVLFFDPRHIRLPGSRLVPGVVRTERGWEAVREAIPRVIVDNVFVHVARTDPAYKTNKRALKQAGYAIINPRLPDKWGVWSALLDQPPIKPYLPETALLLPDTDIDPWLDRHQTVFLKPTRGSGGRGILQVQRAAGQDYTVTRGDASETVSLQALRRLLDTLHHGKGKYLIQQGLSLLDFDQRKVDIRIVLHRDEQKVWQPIATVPRLGDTGQIVTNIEQGGEAQTLDWLQDQTKSIGIRLPARTEIEQVAVMAAAAITQIRPTLGFLGIDIAPDTEGRLWLLDINPRPGRKVLKDEDKRFAFRCLLGYAKRMLSEQQMKGTKKRPRR